MMLQAFNTKLPSSSTRCRSGHLLILCSALVSRVSAARDEYSQIKGIGIGAEHKVRRRTVPRTYGIEEEKNVQKYAVFEINGKLSYAQILAVEKTFEDSNTEYFYVLDVFHGLDQHDDEALLTEIGLDGQLPDSEAQCHDVYTVDLWNTQRDLANEDEYKFSTVTCKFIDEYMDNDTLCLQICLEDCTFRRLFLSVNQYKSLPGKWIFDTDTKAIQHITKTLDRFAEARNIVTEAKEIMKRIKKNKPNRLGTNKRGNRIGYGMRYYHSKHPTRRGTTVRNQQRRFTNKRIRHNCPPRRAQKSQSKGSRTFSF